MPFARASLLAVIRSSLSDSGTPDIVRSTNPGTGSTALTVEALAFLAGDTFFAGFFAGVALGSGFLVAGFFLVMVFFAVISHPQ